MNAGKVFAVVGAAAAVCVLGAVGYLVVDARSGSGDAQDVNTSAQSEAVAVQGPSSGYQVAYGAGGSSVTSTGVPVGYGQDCGSAVAAATAYAVAVVSPLADPAGWDRSSYSDMLAELAGGVSTTAGQQSTEHLLDLLDAAPAATTAIPDAQLYLQDSLYRVSSCQTGSAASVDLALVTGGTAAGTPFGGLMPVSVDVVWSGGDWRLSVLDPFEEWAEWSAMSTAPGSGWVPPLGSQGRSAVVAAGGAGWQEFTNAGD